MTTDATKKIYMIAGEASGDLHGSNLIKALLKNKNSLDIQCWGGEKMAAAGGRLVKHYKDLAFMGFVEVLLNLRTIIGNLKFCKKDILAYQPDILVLIDYPGFNLRIADWAKKNGIKVVYYIAPQVWAWKANRVKMMKQCIDKLLCILPFEQKYFKDKWNWDVAYVGHPLVEVVEQYNSSEAQNIKALQHENIVAVLPGSRKQEIKKKLPIMLSVAKHFPQYQFIIAKAPGLDASFYNQFIQSAANISWVDNQTYALLSRAKAALVTSGTATLETALFKVPEIICYKGNAISYAIAKKLITIKYIGLVNLIMDKLVVKELIQHELHTKNLITQLNIILGNVKEQQLIQKDYEALYQLLKQGGYASEQAAMECLML